MAKLFNLARMTTATTGTGTITLGSAVAGYLSFATAGVGNGDVVAYGIKDGTNSEVGIGTYTAAGTTLTRTVRASTNGGAAISLSGTAEVFICTLKEDLLSITESQTANMFFAAPNGSTAPPTFRAIVTADIPDTTITEAKLSIADNTTKDVSTTAHGFAPKAPNDTTKFLRGDATYAVPAYPWALLTSGSITGSATSLDIVLTSYTSYRALVVIGNSWMPGTDGVGLSLRFSTNGGSTYDSGATDYRYVATAWNDTTPPGQNGAASGTSGTNIMGVTPNANNLVGSASGEGVSFVLWLLDQTNINMKSRFFASGHFVNSSASTQGTMFQSSGHRVTNQDTDAIRFFWSTGNFAASSAGTYALYGLL